jgi:AhpD family alkylhydroperoxidase
MAETNKEILGRLAHGLTHFKKLTPKVPETFAALDKAAFEPGKLDTKTKELIAMAIGVAVRCDGCIAVHTKHAVRAGATAEEIAEALGVAVAMGGGPSVVYSTRALEALAEFTSSPASS